MHRKSALLAFAAVFHVAAAQTSLWVPGFDEQALSADVIGVDTAKGRTTYRIQRGASTAANDDESGFTGTFTLVEGSDYASYNLAQGQVSMTMDCSISGSLGLCSGLDGSTVVTATETVSRFLVQGGSTATDAAMPTGSVSGSGGSGKAATPTKPNAPSETNKSNSAFINTQTTSAGIIALGIAAIFSFL
ncbi:hypothetical protein AAF712_005897 [Marasmius tenuissimus]|uniref:Uncharacterized protein n=1 Tax=Marasmius tenuissimus TaxID=585030 RepID=A0ABR2ZZH8_9AGAR|nr:hypothetical protein PM082_013773 [Marasmius tenuissimus]